MRNPTLIGSTPTSVDHGVLLEPLDSEIWVSSHEDAKRLANEIVDNIYKFGFVDLACIGAGCVNQAIKAIAVAREAMRENNHEVGTLPFFSTIKDDKDRERTRMILRVLCV